MKKLTELYLFSNFAEKNRERIIAELTSEMLVKNRTVKQMAVQEQIATIQRRFKYSSKSQVLDQFTAGNVIPIYDPKMFVPTFIPAWPAFVDKRIVTVVNLSSHAKESMNDILEIEPKKLFGLLQAGSIIGGIIKNENKIINNVSILKKAAKIYTRMFARCLDRLYSLSLEEIQADRASYCIAKFFLIYVVGKTDNETVKGIATSCIPNNSPKSVFERLEGEYELDYTSFPGFIKDLSQVIPSLGTLSLRAFVEAWSRMYGDSTFLSIESFQYFAVNIFSAATSSALNNEGIINNLAGKDVSELYQEFFRIIR
jgi:hypothetical protein